MDTPKAAYFSVKHIRRCCLAERQVSLVLSHVEARINLFFKKENNDYQK
jgi:hypothetical protein